MDLQKIKILSSFTFFTNKYFSEKIISLCGSI